MALAPSTVSEYRLLPPSPAAVHAPALGAASGTSPLSRRRGTAATAAAPESPGLSPGSSPSRRPAVTPTGGAWAPAAFTWNKRRCSGNAFHVVVLEGSHQDVRAAIKAAPDVVLSRFTYETVFRGVTQEGSGEAVHLAASRGHVDVMQELLRAGAELEASVTRDQKTHYDVLHAAVFAEGRGGDPGMVKYLIERKAPMIKNLDNKWPLHIAFQIGAVGLLDMLRRQVIALDMGDAFWGGAADRSQPSPLELGIQFGHMTERELSEAAAPTIMSLMTFIEHEPRCLPVFLARLRANGFDLRRIAAHVRVDDHVVNLIRRCPRAAVALMDVLVCRPEEEVPGIHSLPARVSFAPRSFVGLLRSTLNSHRDFMTFYEGETTWRYDVGSQRAPRWHSRIDSERTMVSGLQRNMVRDAAVEVCLVPGLISAPFFAALLDSAGGAAACRESVEVFKPNVVRGAIHHAWWHGACRLDILHVVLSIWGLLLLMFDGFHRLPHMLLSANFVLAKGIVDSSCGAVRLVGCLKHRQRWGSIFNQDNMWDMVRCVMPLMFPFCGRTSFVRPFVVFVYWWQFLGMFTVSEYIAHAVLPILRLARGLVPAISLTMVWCCAFTEAFQTVREGGNSDALGNVFDTFATLFTSSLPEEGEHQMSTLELSLYMFAVIFFSVFLFNIFIGVISEEHEFQQDICTETFRMVRARLCMNFLTSSSVLPCRLASKRVASQVLALAGATGVGVQLAGLWRGAPLRGTCPVLVGCMFVMVLATYQNPNAHWSGETQEKSYLWIVRASDGDEEDPEDPDKVPCRAGGDESPAVSTIAYRW